MTAEDRLSLAEAADHLGVHYMTAYRYVRTGQLPARRDGATWSVATRDIAAFKKAHAKRSPTRPRRVDRVARLKGRLIEGDEHGAWMIVESALASGVEPAELYRDVLIPALVEIGDEWSLGTMSVTEEHRASAVALRLVGRLGPHFSRRGRSRGTVIVGAPPGDPHSLPGAFISDLLRAKGFEVIDLGANVPAASFVEASLAADRRVAVLVGATSPETVAAVRTVTAALHRANITNVLVGGGAVRDADHARTLGADDWTGLDSNGVLAAVENRATRNH